MHKLVAKSNYEKLRAFLGLRSSTEIANITGYSKQFISYLWYGKGRLSPEAAEILHKSVDKRWRDLQGQKEELHSFIDKAAEIYFDQKESDDRKYKRKAK